MRKTSLAGLKKKLWKIFSEYVRRKDCFTDVLCEGFTSCFTCGLRSHWKTLDAGHYHAGSTSLRLFFDERNVHPQCTACNRFRHGNLTAYAVALRKKYGEGILEELDALRHQPVKYSRSDYEGFIQIYQDKLKDLEGLGGTILGDR